ncbi:FAD-dependent oxidoreductase [Afipia sp. 1NLS2]|uniref:dihydrolipoyl dehydrogenase family protein n=1 Tax=Afipia sp. 1NLS2 TaxID=666684 RepID=UPI0001D9F525|nr:FAD-dependent oxidoreductase [Afipia sp. 1NLS2]EFI53057.1 FAD-dependent pyridine nucleotide-disulfide oxidoreductase [Afipia sp. 1NLS2]
MPKALRCDVCVIGAGSAGLSVAAGAAMLGARTILFERGEMGGDCLNYGCVPSKSLLAAAHAARNIRQAARFGIHGSDVRIDFSAVVAHVRQVIAAIAPHDSVERFESLGVRVIKAPARFAGPGEIEGGGVRVRTKRIVIATGSTAAVPNIPGIDTVPYLTNESVFSLNARPDHLLIIGGGPIGVEMAQAFRRLGSSVTIFQRRRLLPKDEPEFVELLRAELAAEGIAIHEEVEIASVASTSNGIAIGLGGQPEPIIGSHLLVAAGRRPRLAGLDLQTGGVLHTEKGVVVDAQLRTSNKRVYALGDVIGGPLFTHAASYQAGIVIRNALFRLPAKADYRALPWVTYTDPELAHVGLAEAQARELLGDRVRVTRADFTDNDRAQAEREISGGIKIITNQKGTILGATILGSQAGELIQLWALAISRKLKLSALTALILPYPTRGEISKSAASAFYAPKLFRPWPKRLVRLLLWLS